MYNPIMPLVWISLAFIAGIIAASLITLSWQVWLGMGLASAFAATLIALLARLPRFSGNSFLAYIARAKPLYVATLVVFFLGAARYQYQQPDPDDPFFIAFYNDRAYEVLVTGTLEEPPDIRDKYANLRINVEAVDTGSGDMPAYGLALARVNLSQIYAGGGEPLKYGDRVRIRGELQTPPENEDFSYRDYLAQNGVYSVIAKTEVTILPGNGGNFFFRQVYALKASLLEKIYAIYHDPEASLLAGILLGVDTGLTPQLQQAFKNTGTSHIIAISGFNIAIIAGIFFSLFKNFFGIFIEGVTGKRLGAVLAVFAIALYAILVGADAAVLRAAFMGGLSLFAKQVGRRNNGLNGLAFASILMLAGNPMLWRDVGFQLSSLATLGLILYAEPFSNFAANLLARISRHDISAFTRFVNDNIILTFAAQVTTIPIMAYHFQRISLISFIANIFILPFQPAVMLLGGLAAIVSMFALPLGKVLAWVATPFPLYTIRVVELFDRVPYGVRVLGNFSLWQMLLAYAALFALTFNWDSLAKWYNAQKESLRAAAFTATLIFLFACSILAWQATSAAGDGQLHVTFFEVGSADAVLIQTPAGRNVLINGGESAAELSDELGRRMPFYEKNLDWLVVASADENDLAALPRVVERYPPEKVLQSGNFQASFSAQALEKYFALNEIPVHRAEAGQRLDMGADMSIEVLAANGRGSVLLVQYKKFRALLPLGVDADTYQLLEDEKALDKVDVLLLADSGYAASNPPEALKKLNPQLIILSVEAGDPNGLPNRELLEEFAGYSLLRTDLNGWITVSTDGEEMRVDVERGNVEPTPTP